MANTDWNNEFGASYGKAVARAWVDADYKAKLLRDPRAALSEVGIEFPAGKNVTVTENDGKNIQLSLPPKPEGEISDEALLTESGGICASEYCCSSAG